MAAPSAKPKLQRDVKLHGFFLLMGAVVVWWGFGGIADDLKHPLYMGADWRGGAAIILFGGMITGVAVNNLAQHWMQNRKRKP